MEAKNAERRSRCFGAVNSFEGAVNIALAGIYTKTR